VDIPVRYPVDFKSSLKEKKFSIFICPSRARDAHSHNFLELAYVLQGEAVHNWDDRSMHIREGDYFVIDYQSRHSYAAKTEEFRLINCLFVPELIDPSLTNCRSLQTLICNYQIHFRHGFFTANPAGNIYQDSDGKIRALLLSVLEEFNGEMPGYLQMIRSRIIEILILTMRKIYLAPALEPNDSSMEQILRYIGAEYMNDITLKDICRRFNYSFSYMSQKFKKVFGMTYVAYLQKTRIEQSMRLLAHTDEPVGDIAQAVGYRDIKSFYTAFRNVSNTTPVRFRKQFIGKGDAVVGGDLHFY